MDTLPLELSFQIENWGHPDGPVIEILARGPGIEDRVEHARNKQILRERKITGRDWVILGNINRQGYYWSEWSFDLDIDDAWVVSQVPESVKKKAWGTMRANPRKFRLRVVDANEGLYTYGPASIELSGPAGGEWWATIRFKNQEKDVEARSEEEVLEKATQWVDDAPELSRDDNPNRPPKHWFQDCVAGASSSADDPNAVCGSLWYHKMSASQRRAALAQERRDNPGGAGAGLVLAVGALIAAGAWWLFKEDKPAAAAGPATGTKSPLPPAPVTNCVLNPVDMAAWATASGVVLIPTPSLDAAPSLSELQKNPTIAAIIAQAPPGKLVVIVLKDGSFWGYDASGTPVLDVPHKASYCAYKAPGGTAGVQGPPRTWLP